MPPSDPPHESEFAYLKQVFVDGEPSAADILELMPRQRTRRIISLVGPPGVGKSSLLWRIDESMRNDHLRIGYSPIMLDLTQMRHADAIELEKELAQWLDRTQQAMGLAIAPRTFANWFHAFSQTICDHCGDRVVVLLLDGIEELMPELRSWVYEQVLGRFLAHTSADGPLCARSILTRRNKDGLPGTLITKYKEHPEHLKGWSLDNPAPKAKEQVQRLVAFLAQGDAGDAAAFPTLLHQRPLTAAQTAHITAQARDKGAIVLQEMESYLSSSPWVNAVLTGYLVIEPDLRIKAEHLTHCQRRYIERIWSGRQPSAGAPTPPNNPYRDRTRPSNEPDAVDQILGQLRALIRLLQDPTLGQPAVNLSAWAEDELEARREKREKLVPTDGDSFLKRLTIEALKPLFVYGIVSDDDAGAYKVDPAFVKLYNDTERLQSAAPTAITTL